MTPPLENARSSFASRVATLLALVMAGVALATLDFAVVGRALHAAGGFLLLVPLPFVLVSLLDANAWRLAERAEQALFLRFHAIRLGLEAVSLTVPGGPVAADGVAPALLSRRLGVDLPAAITTVALKKWGIVAGHALVLLVAASVSGGFTARAARAIDLPIPPRALLVAGFFVGVSCAIGLGAGLRGGIATAIHGLVRRVRVGAVQRFAARLDRGAASADRVAASFFEGPVERPIALALVCACVWLAEVFEVWVLLSILGTQPRMLDVLALEALVGLSRAAAFFSPGGLGAQELVYLSLAELAMGHPSPGAGGALVVLRRARDVVVIGVGYGLLAVRAETTPSPEAAAA